MAFLQNRPTTFFGSIYESDGLFIKTSSTKTMSMRVFSEKLKRVDDFMATGQRFHPETILKWILDTNSVQINRFDECTKINRGNNEFL